MRVMRYIALLLLIVLPSGLTPTSEASSEPASVVSATAPVYPVIAQAAKASGDVLVDIEIDRDGKVSSAHAVRAHQLLRQVSEQAARRWEFSPSASSNKRKAQLTFSFRIVSETASGLDRRPVFYPPYRFEVKSDHLVIETNYSRARRKTPR